MSFGMCVIIRTMFCELYSVDCEFGVHARTSMLELVRKHE